MERTNRSRHLGNRRLHPVRSQKAPGLLHPVGNLVSNTNSTSQKEKVRGFLLLTIHLQCFVLLTCKRLHSQVGHIFRFCVIRQNKIET